MKGNSIGDGSVTEYWFDDETESMRTRTFSVVDALLDKNKAAKNDGTNGYISKSRDLRKIAELDMTTVLKLKSMGIDVYNKDDNPKLMRWLRDPDNKQFRTVDKI